MSETLSPSVSADLAPELYQWPSSSSVVNDCNAVEVEPKTNSISDMRTAALECVGSLPILQGDRVVFLSFRITSRCKESLFHSLSPLTLRGIDDEKLGGKELHPTSYEGPSWGAFVSLATPQGIKIGLTL